MYRLKIRFHKFNRDGSIPRGSPRGWMPPAVIGAKPRSVIPRGLRRGGFIDEIVDCALIEITAMICTQDAVVASVIIASIRARDSLGKLSAMISRARRSASASVLCIRTSCGKGIPGRWASSNAPNVPSFSASRNHRPSGNSPTSNLGEDLPPKIISNCVASASVRNSGAGSCYDGRNHGKDINELTGRGVRGTANAGATPQDLAGHATTRPAYS